MKTNHYFFSFNLLVYFPQLQPSNLRLRLSLSPQDLSNERTRSQELSAEVQRLRENLQKAEAELVIASASLSESQERIDSLSKLLDQSHLCSENIDIVEAVANSDSSSTVRVCQSRSQTPQVDQSPEAGESHESSPTKGGDAGETERQLRERLNALEREVCEYGFAVATENSRMSATITAF